jgi:hypothetical protein
VYIDTALQFVGFFTPISRTTAMLSSDLIWHCHGVCMLQHVWGLCVNPLSTLFCSLEKIVPYKPWESMHNNFVLFCSNIQSQPWPPQNVLCTILGLEDMSGIFQPRVYMVCCWSPFISVLLFQMLFCLHDYFQQLHSHGLHISLIWHYMMCLTGIGACLSWNLCTVLCTYVECRGNEPLENICQLLEQIMWCLICVMECFGSHWGSHLQSGTSCIKTKSAVYKSCAPVNSNKSSPLMNMNR